MKFKIENQKTTALPIFRTSLSFVMSFYYKYIKAMSPSSFFRLTWPMCLTLWYPAFIEPDAIKSLALVKSKICVQQGPDF